MCVHHPNTPRRLARNSRQRRPGGWTAGKLGRPRQAPAQSRTSRLAEGPAARWGLATLGAACSRRPETLAQWQAQPQQTARFDANACRLGPARNQGRRSGRRGTRPRPTRTRETPREIAESATQQPKPVRLAGAGRGPAYLRARLIGWGITIDSDHFSTPRQGCASRQRRRAATTQAPANFTTLGVADRRGRPSSCDSRRISPAARRSPTAHRAGPPKTAACRPKPVSPPASAVQFGQKRQRPTQVPQRVPRWAASLAFPLKLKRADYSAAVTSSVTFAVTSWCSLMVTGYSPTVRMLSGSTMSRRSTR